MHQRALLLNLDGPWPLRHTPTAKSEVVTWSHWKERHPVTLVLDRGGEDTGFMGTFALSE